MLLLTTDSTKPVYQIFFVKQMKFNIWQLKAVYIRFQVIYTIFFVKQMKFIPADLYKNIWHY